MSQVCVLSIGGEWDTPSACCESVASSFEDVEEVLDHLVDISVDRSCPVVPHDLLVENDARVSFFPERRNKVEKVSTLYSTLVMGHYYYIHLNKSTLIIVLLYNVIIPDYRLQLECSSWYNTFVYYVIIPRYIK